MSFPLKSIPIEDYIAERTGILANEQIARYIEELSMDKSVFASVLIAADSKACELLSPNERIEHAHITSGHALSFLRRHKLPDKGLQDLQRAQYRVAKAQLANDETQNTKPTKIKQGLTFLRSLTSKNR